MRLGTIIVVTAALSSLPCVARAQGFFEGAREGYARGDAAAGPVGGVVAGAFGAGVGTVNGALGIHDRPVVVAPASFESATAVRRHRLHRPHRRRSQRREP